MSESHFPNSGSIRGLDGKSLVLQAVDIVQLIGQTVSLKKRGRSYTGLCPFHNEKTPSFHAEDRKGRYHCFGCGVSGDHFTFLVELEGLPFPEAVAQLAAEAGGTLAIALRRFRHRREADAFVLPSAAVTRWRVSQRPSAPLPVPGIGRARWLLELMRCRAGETAEFEVEASDGEGRIAFSPRLADRSPAAGHGRRRAAG